MNNPKRPGWATDAAAAVHVAELELSAADAALAEAQARHTAAQARLTAAQMRHTEALRALLVARCLEVAARRKQPPTS